MSEPIAVVMATKDVGKAVRRAEELNALRRTDLIVWEAVHAREDEKVEVVAYRTDRRR